MKRPALVLLVLLPIVACAPVRDGDDDDSSGGGGGSTVEDVWEDLAEGECAVLPVGNGILDAGQAWATSGAWNELQCTPVASDGSQVILEPEWFDERAGGDFAVASVRATTAGGSTVGLEGDSGTLHLLEGEWGTLNGWWLGDLRGEDAAGSAVRIEAVVFKDTRVDQVDGR